MAISEVKAREYSRRLLLSRMRILCENGFYGLLLMHIIFSIDEEVETACTDGVRITFGTSFLDDISDKELDFVMMHEILHVVLQHVARGVERDNEAFNIACDIVVNSNILLSWGMDKKKITLEKYGEAMNLAPNGKNGYEYTAEEIYEMLPNYMKQPKNSSGGGGGGGSSSEGGSSSDGGSDGAAKGKRSSGASGAGAEKKQGARACGATWDDHSRWGLMENDSALREAWVKRFEDACEAISVRDPSNSRGTLPLFAERLLESLKAPSVNWRELLCNFIQEEVNDYSFSPPDRRFQDSGFFLPDFNDTDESVRNVLFMIDTSGSMSDEMITEAYSEIAGAIEQFGGKLQGWLGFFDAAIVEPKPFVSLEEFIVIRPAGGGGTDFGIIFDYVREYMQDEPPVSIVILTDGYAPFPSESMAMDIPVLWLVNNETVDPPWGKVARMVRNKK